MNILIDPGTYDCLNVGDVAMLQVAVQRLSSLWPSPAIHVITESADLLSKHCPCVKPVPAAGRNIWFADRTLLGSVHNVLPAFASQHLVRWKHTLRRRFSTQMEHLVRLRLGSNGKLAEDLTRFLTHLRHADLVVIAGQAALNDTCYSHAKAVLGLLEMAIDQGTPVVMFGQGIGPLQNDELVRYSAKVLPHVSLIALREGRAAVPLLDSLGVNVSRVMVTGDDAIELAYRSRSARIGNGIGVNLRIAQSTAVDSTYVDLLRPILQSFARTCNAPLIPVPIAIHRPGTYDPDSILQLLRGFDDTTDGGASIDTPSSLIDQIKRCRVVVTGAYHAAVFALSLGIPAVCLARSVYSFDKFLGLKELFGQACNVVDLDEPDLSGSLVRVMECAWKQANHVKASLEAAALHMIELGLASYQYVHDNVIQRAGRPVLLRQTPLLHLVSL